MLSVGVRQVSVGVKHVSVGVRDEACFGKGEGLSLIHI